MEIGDLIMPERPLVRNRVQVGAFDSRTIAEKILDGDLNPDPTEPTLTQESLSEVDPPDPTEPSIPPEVFTTESIPAPPKKKKASTK